MPQFEAQGQVGVQELGEGAKGTLRQGRDAALVAHLAGAKYYDLVSRGVVYLGQTAVAGVAPGTALGTTAAFSLYNPAGSGKVLVVLQGSMGYVSGTLGAGVVTWAANTTTAQLASDPSGTAIPARNALIGGPANNVGLPLTTVTLAAAPTPVRPFCSLGASLASTAVQPWQVVDDVDGALIVKPGKVLSLHATAAAGSTPLVVFGCMWAELPE